MRQNSGFTLLELSIVLVTIGLIAGGIAVGAGMVHNGEMRSLLSDFRHYNASVATFRAKYNGLPGDLANATAIWGAANATAATCYTTSSTGQQATCNGNGDGQIDSADGGTTHSERFRFWQQLVNAGLAEGNFSGVGGPGGSADSLPRTNIPAPRFMTAAGFTAVWYNLPTGDSDFFPVVGNTLVFGADSGSDASMDGMVPPDDAFNIDTKMDDGVPGTGSVQGLISTSTHATGCVTTAAANTARYDVANPDHLCTLVVQIN